MGLRLHNTLTRTKEDFVPIDPANVRMYVCGPTVYDFAHIGNARPLIVFDVLFRLLRHLYGPEHVTYVRNITDVEDKINARAAEEYPQLPLNQAIREVTTRTEKQFHEDVAALGCLPPTFEPRATEFISRSDLPEDMIRLIGKLVETGHAYAAEGHVLFHVPSMPDYGRLSNRSLDEMIAGARVEVAPYKRDPTDFVLWKPSQPGEPAWPSPWGAGRPGWHIECSAMAGALLGDTFDIHGGGIDLIFPHHENEIAQSRSAHGTALMARYWLHNGFLQVEGEKMSKSLGNFVTIRELLENWPGNAIRLAMLETHYRLPLNWTTDGLVRAMEELRSWAEVIRLDFDVTLPVPEGELDPDFIAALSDDLNTSLAITILRQMYKNVKDRSAAQRFARHADFLGLSRVDKPGFFHLGFVAHLRKYLGDQITDDLERTIISYRAAVANGMFQSASTNLKRLQDSGISVSLDDAGILQVGNTADEVASRIAARVAARKAKNFAEADRIRAELDVMGIALKDSKDPRTGELVTTWEVKR